MIFKISWAADPSRSGTVWFRLGMVPSCHINYQKFGEFMFGKIITKKMIFTSNLSSVLFRHTRIIISDSQQIQPISNILKVL